MNIIIFTSFVLGCSLLAGATSSKNGVENDFPSVVDYFKSVEKEAALNVVHHLAKTNFGKGCYCDHKTICSCCENIYIAKYNINQTACLELIYLPQDLGISLIFEVDNIILLNKTVSARNPPPVCETVPRVEIAKVCVQLYDLDYQYKIISGCARVIGKIEGFVIFKMKIGCFRHRMEDLIDESAQDVYLVQKEDEEY